MANELTEPDITPNTDPSARENAPIVHNVVDINFVDRLRPQRYDWKKKLAAFSGNFLEWYDFSIYGYFSDVIGQTFLPEKDKNLNLAMSFLIFGTAFFARPIGSLVLGKIGDRYGSKVSIEIAILMMGISSACIAFLPSYNVAGNLGGILLIILRALQGFSMGGQYVGSMMFAVHGVPREHRGYEFCIAALSGNCGFLFGNIISFVMRSTTNKEQLHDWGWRVPFLLAVLACPAAMYLKLAVEDDHHDDEDNSQLNHVKEVFSCWNLRPTLCFAAVVALGSSGSYILFIWLPMWMNTLATPPIAHPFLINTVAQLISQILLLPFMGIIIDRSNKAAALFVCCISQILLFPLGFHLMQTTKNPYVAGASMTIIGIFNGAINPAAMFTFFFDKFPSKIRMTAMGFSYNIGAAVFGGLSPAVATLLHKYDHFAPSYLIIGAGCLSLSGLAGAITYFPPHDMFLRLSSEISISESPDVLQPMLQINLAHTDDIQTPLLQPNDTTNAQNPDSSQNA